MIFFIVIFRPHGRRITGYRLLPSVPRPLLESKIECLLLYWFICECGYQCSQWSIIPYQRQLGSWSARMYVCMHSSSNIQHMYFFYCNIFTIFYIHHFFYIFNTYIHQYVFYLYFICLLACLFVWSQQQALPKRTQNMKTPLQHTTNLVCITLQDSKTAVIWSRVNSTGINSTVYHHHPCQRRQWGIMVVIFIFIHISGVVCGEDSRMVMEIEVIIVTTAATVIPLSVWWNRL